LGYGAHLALHCFSKKRAGFYHWGGGIDPNGFAHFEHGLDAANDYPPGGRAEDASFPSFSGRLALGGRLSEILFLGKISG